MNSNFYHWPSEQTKNHIRSIVNRVLSDIYALSMQLTPEQDNEFLKNFREKQQKYYEEDYHWMMKTRESDIEVENRR